MHKITHRSKIGLEIVLPIAAILGMITFLMVRHQVWIGLAICTIIIGLIVHVFASTTYTITHERLLVRCGMIESYDINIDEIEVIKKTRELTNAPALSTDRIEIYYRSGRILLSPVDKKKFSQDLVRVNPHISIYF